MNRKTGLALFVLAAVSFALSLGRSIEIPLEGYGKSTNIAYVNMHRIFEAFPETEQARIELNKTIDDKKSEITRKKEEIAQLKAEIEFLRRQMSAGTPAPAPKAPEPPPFSPEEPQAEPLPEEQPPVRE